MGKENCQGLTGLTVNTPKMHTFPYSHIKISIYIFITKVSQVNKYQLACL